MAVAGGYGSRGDRTALGTADRTSNAARPGDADARIVGIGGDIEAFELARTPGYGARRWLAGGNLSPLRADPFAVLETAMGCQIHQRLKSFSNAVRGSSEDRDDVLLAERGSVVRFSTRLRGVKLSHELRVVLLDTRAVTPARHSNRAPGSKLMQFLQVWRSALHLVQAASAVTPPNASSTSAPHIPHRSISRNAVMFGDFGPSAWRGF